MSKSTKSETDALEERLIALETRIAYQDRMIEELSGVIATQDRKIEDLTHKLREIARQIEPLFNADKNSGVAGDGSAAEKPPHY